MCAWRAVIGKTKTRLLDRLEGVMVDVFRHDISRDSSAFFYLTCASLSFQPLLNDAPVPLYKVF